MDLKDCIEFANKNPVCWLSTIEGIMGILSKKWALLIISAIGNNRKLRYNEL